MSIFDNIRVQIARTPEIRVDWGKFQTDKLRRIRRDEHKFFISDSRKAWWDDCCHRQVLSSDPADDRSELAYVGPYLKAIQRRAEEVPHLPHMELLSRRPPLYFNLPVTHEEDLIYVDLDRAYWSIYTRTTLDVAYDGANYPRRGTVEFLEAEELGSMKLAYVGLMGYLHRMKQRILDHGEYQIEPVTSNRPDLWGLLMDCLEVVAWSARDLGALYYHTDGAIFPTAEQGREWQSTLLDRFGLNSSVKAQGPGAVYALGRYRVGQTTGGRGLPGEELLNSRSGRVDSMRELTRSSEQCLTEWLKGAIMMASLLIPTERAGP